jgi:asparagine N-glycosylation enzyme membrane subunit Stt3
VVVEFFLIYCIINDHRSVRVLLSASHVQFKLYTVFGSIASSRIDWLSQITLVNALMVFKNPWISFNGNKADPMSEVLIGYHRCVLPHIDLFNGHRGNLSDQYSSQCICQWRLSSNQVKYDLLFIEF